jgi:hypothetical protein
MKKDDKKSFILNFLKRNQKNQMINKDKLEKKPIIELEF